MAVDAATDQSVLLRCRAKLEAKLPSVSRRKSSEFVTASLSLRKRSSGAWDVVARVGVGEGFALAEPSVSPASLSVPDVAKGSVGSGAVPLGCSMTAIVKGPKRGVVRLGFEYFAG